MKKNDLYICTALINIHLILIGALITRSYIIYNEGSLLDQLTGNPVLLVLLVFNIALLLLNMFDLIKKTNK